MYKKSIIASLSVVLVMGFSTAVQAQNNMAMTWGTKTPKALKGKIDKDNRIVVVGCSGCNAYKGDTDIRTKPKRHILCIVPGNEPAPTIYTTEYATRKFYYNWSGARIGLSKKVRGSTITSRAVGDRFCKTDLKDGRARMIEHHDNKVGGWNLGGFIHLRSRAKGKLRNPNAGHRFWASIRNQPANPWD